MTLATPYFTHVYRATIKERAPKNHVVMRFEVAADVLSHAESIVDDFIREKHSALYHRGYRATIKRIVREHTEAVILVG